MSYQERNLTCVECGQSFIFSADDQSYHAEKGYTNEPWQRGHGTVPAPW